MLTSPVREVHKRNTSSPSPTNCELSLPPYTYLSDWPIPFPPSLFLSRASIHPTNPSHSHECGPFRCNIYLDDPANPSTSHLLGNIICFVAPQDDECGNCEGQRAAGKEVESSTIISARLRELHQQGVIGADYEEAMSKGLRWQVRNMRVRTYLLAYDKR